MEPVEEVFGEAVSPNGETADDSGLLRKLAETTGDIKDSEAETVKPIPSVAETVESKQNQEIPAHPYLKPSSLQQCLSI